MMLFAGNSFADNISIYLENDVLNNSDKYYTHGTRISCSTNEGCSYHIGQLMYTPSDISITELMKDDRPYGGWLYASYVNYVTYEGYENWNGYYEYSIGVVGPKSFSGETQAWVHEIIDSREPMGWDNQLKNELAIQFLLKQEYMLTDKYSSLRPYCTVALGNVFDYIGFGTTLYYGYNIPNGFIDNSISMRNLSNFHIYFGLSWEGRLVARNIFLDGNTCKDSHSVKKENFVRDIDVSVSVGYKNLNLSLTHIMRSKEFKKQEESVKFDAIMLQWQW